MRLSITAAAAVVTSLALTPATASGHAIRKHRKHVPGCRTHACDRRIGKWLARYERRHRPAAVATASFYDDGGSTACGTHYTYGFAHLGPGEGAYAGMACGTRVRFCAARCAVGTMDDHGPYVSGREFDLNRALKDAIGASDLGTVRYKVLG